MNYVCIYVVVVIGCIICIVRICYLWLARKENARHIASCQLCLLHVWLRLEWLQCKTAHMLLLVCVHFQWCVLIKCVRFIYMCRKHRIIRVRRKYELDNATFVWCVSSISPKQSCNWIILLIIYVHVVAQENAKPCRNFCEWLCVGKYAVGFSKIITLLCI